MDRYGQEALGRVEIYVCWGAARKIDDAGGGVASRCLGCLVVCEYLAAYR
jgi:hypothetical protein